MELSELYAGELSYLKDAARAFAQRHPDGAASLLAHSDDPDVERLLEGVAFLTAGMRARIEQAGAQIAHGLAELILPHFLRSLPSTSIVEFAPNIKALRTRQTIPRGHKLTAREVHGTSCRFRTCFDVDLWPLTVQDAALEQRPGPLPIEEMGRRKNVLGSRGIPILRLSSIPRHDLAPAPPLERSRVPMTGP